MRRILILGLPLALTAAAAPQPAGTRQCISLSNILSRTADGDSAIVFRMLGNRAYRNVLNGRCPGLDRIKNFNALALEPTGSQLCRGDVIRPFDPQLTPSLGLNSAPRCRLGTFVAIPVTRETGRQ